MSKESLTEVAENILIEALKLKEHKHPAYKAIREELDEMVTINEGEKRFINAGEGAEWESITEIAERIINEIIKLDEKTYPSCSVIRRKANEIMFSNHLSEKQISEHNRKIKLREAVVTFEESAL